jgi:hypothetical protein
MWRQISRKWNCTDKEFDMHLKLDLEGAQTGGVGLGGIGYFSRNGHLLGVLAGARSSVVGAFEKQRG